MKTTIFRLISLLLILCIVSCNKEELNEIENIQDTDIPTELIQLKEHFNLNIRKATPEETENAIYISYEDFINLLEQREYEISTNKTTIQAVEELEGLYSENGLGELTGYAGIIYGPKNAQVSLNLEFLFELNHHDFGRATSGKFIYLKINNSLAENIKSYCDRTNFTLVTLNTFYITFIFSYEEEIYSVFNPWAQLDITFHPLLRIFTYTYVF